MGDINSNPIDKGEKELENNTPLNRIVLKKLSGHRLLNLSICSFLVCFAAKNGLELGAQLF